MNELTQAHGKRSVGSVVIVGGGLAGLAAATALAPRGYAVTIVESRPRLGGRASSFADPATGQLIDNCQHVTMGCCSQFAQFCRTVGIDHFLGRQPTLYFMTPDRRISRWHADPWPAPFHFARSFLTAHFLTLSEKLRVTRGLGALLQDRTNDDPPFRDWLQVHRQTERTIDRFWGLVLTSALNESPDRVGLRYARKVFVDAFLRDRTGGDVYVPTVPLGRLYGEELRSWLDRHGVRVRLGEGVRTIQMEADRVTAVELRSGELVRADSVICSVPFDRLPALLPSKCLDYDYFSRIRRLESSPITSVHIWFDRPVLTLPHVVLVEGVGQWIFNRGRTESGDSYVQVVVSAARQFAGLNHEEVQGLIRDEIHRLFPAARSATVRRIRTITEQSATFSAVPGVDQFRPEQQSPIANLFLAGDWTQTGWPATMEGAVRSGYFAAEALANDGKLLPASQPVLNADWKL